MLQSGVQCYLCASLECAATNAEERECCVREFEAVVGVQEKVCNMSVFRDSPGPPRHQLPNYCH